MINLFKVIYEGTENKTNGSMFNRKHKGSEHTRRILLLYLGALLLFHETLLLFSLLFLCLMESKAERIRSLRLQSLYTPLLLCDICRVRCQSRSFQVTEVSHRMRNSILHIQIFCYRK